MDTHSIPLWPGYAVQHISSYLSLRECLFSLAVLTKHHYAKVTDLKPLIYRRHIANGEVLLQCAHTEQLREAIESVPQLLKFSALYYNGGVSDLDVKCAFENMWKYSGSVYHTHYSSDGGSLNKNRICAAYFAGVPGEDLMHQEFHYDLCLIKYRSYNLKDEVRRALTENYENALTFKFLSESTTPQMDSMTLHRHFTEIPKTVEPMEKRYEYAPEAPDIAIVKEVCIARPLCFTGLVKTLMIFAGRRSGSQYNPEQFNRWEDIDTIEKALNVPGIVTWKQLKGVNFVEYIPADSDYYPLLWVQFKDLAHNNIRVKLSRPHAILQTTVVMYDIEDRRALYDLSSSQPNFDIMFVIFLGSIFSMSPHNI